MLNRFCHIPIVAILLLVAATVFASGDPFVLQSKAVTVTISRDGRLTGITLNKSHEHKALLAFTAIESFISRRDIAIQSPDKKSIRFEHDLYSDSLQQSCTLVETFIATNNSIHWQLEIKGKTEAWSGRIKTVVRYPVTKGSRFWTSWGAPQFDSANCDPRLVASLSPYKNNFAKGWLDPWCRCLSAGRPIIMARHHLHTMIQKQDLFLHRVIFSPFHLHLCLRKNPGQVYLFF